MRPFSPHARFFSSLKQTENRLQSEKCGNLKSTPVFLSDTQLSSPLFLDYSHPHEEGNVRENSSFSKIPDGSCPSLDFLSSSSYLKAEDNEEQEQQKIEDPKPQSGHEEHNELNEIEKLISLLGLSVNGVDEGGNSCDCSGGGFYSKVAGIRGPKCNKEKKRLDKWIDCFVMAKKEPARLAHLLLAKAAMLQGEEENDDFGRVEFPVTIREFFEHDPSMKDEQRI